MKKRTAVLAGILVPLVVAGGVVYALRTEGSAEATAAEYLQAWSKGDYPAMRGLVADAPGDFERWYKGFHDDLKLTSASFTPEAAHEGDGATTVDFRAELRGPVDFGYTGTLRLVERGHRWQVAFSPSVIHRDLKQGTRFKVTQVPAESAPILAADGTRLDVPSSPGSVLQLVEGLKQQYGPRLLGKPSARVDIVKDGKVVTTVARGARVPGQPLRTTIDLRVHRAGAQAMEKITKPASLVALRPSTGEVLAVVNRPGGFNRALLGKYPPGSTFKIVTASALVAGGMAPDDMVNCPPQQTIGGFAFHNAEFHDYGRLSFRDAFAHSCNTTFGGLAVDKLGRARLAEVAHGFGFGAPIAPGVPAVRADFPDPHDDTDLASAAIGQGRVLASPLNMAAVAGAIVAGTWRQPRMVPQSLVPAGGTAPRVLEPAVVRALRTLMPAVVSEGTARGISFPAGTAGKTGTAEYGSGDNPPTHSWFIGYHRDLAFAVIVEGGGTGAAVAAPVAARFLSGVATG
ncbi:penicillin-binding transpeptidase domain-containing protein [Sphaerisporangium fuscum]|uniref:penicillin-binding transpeptidase domain-containing protein n=1 Tax=Sphaerisporangium fuscum TaxID=2835868 RepID=UPI001BDC74D8|nr:penicillin-binding transpeptidase domain-containing protein [Sphaerisporangium fuscum]